MKSALRSFVLCFTLVASMHGQQSPTGQLTEIQAALREASWTAGSSAIFGTATHSHIGF
jgi:hypothetical protein